MVPVEVDNVVAGVEARHGIFTFTASVFRTEIDNAQAPEYGSFLGTTGRDIRHDLVSKGYELGADAVWETGRAGVRFAGIDVTEDGGPLTSDSQYLATPVGDILSLFLQKRIPNTNVTVGGDVQVAFKYDDFAGEFFEGTTLLPLQGQEVVNVFAEYKPERFQGLTLRAEVNKIFDESYADRASYGGEFTDVLEQLLEPGRSFYVSATRRF